MKKVPAPIRDVNVVLESLDVKGSLIAGEENVVCSGVVKNLGIPTSVAIIVKLNGMKDKQTYLLDSGEEKSFEFRMKIPPEMKGWRALSVWVIPALDPTRATIKGKKVYVTDNKILAFIVDNKLLIGLGIALIFIILLLAKK
ncbi:hypothetical protein B6U74_01865 [Candidatus Bathyarchaeota archaeon ex4484_205]|nr:MAG: hypothetical protein B6U74_01865 [Candidatus Bathyarchaeota archaeon ex4484_205]